MYTKRFILLILFSFPLTILALPNKDQFKYICMLSKDSPAIQSAILQGSIERHTEREVKRWLQELPDTIKISPLLFAVKNNANISIVVAILKYIKLLNLDFYNIHDTQGMSIFSIATINKDKSLVNLLLKNKASLSWDANNFRTSALHFAAIHGYLEIINIMLDYNHTNKTLTIHSYDASSYTPLSYLILNSQNKYVINLLFKYPPTYTVAYIGTKSYYTLAKVRKMTSIMETLDNLLSTNKISKE